MPAAAREAPDSGAPIETDGDQATARGAQLSSHVLADGSGEAFVSAGHADHELVRTADDWRIVGMSLRIAWTQGTPPGRPAGPAAEG